MAADITVPAVAEGPWAAIEGIRMCERNSSAPPRAARHSGDKQNRRTNAEFNEKVPQVASSGNVS